MKNFKIEITDDLLLNTMIVWKKAKDKQAKDFLSTNILIPLIQNIVDIKVEYAVKKFGKYGNIKNWSEEEMTAFKNDVVYYAFSKLQNSSTEKNGLYIRNYINALVRVYMFSTHTASRIEKEILNKI